MLMGKIGYILRSLVGGLFLLLSGAICVQLILALRQNPSPVTSPLSLKRGAVITSKFRTDIAYDSYEISLRVDAKPVELAAMNRAGADRSPSGQNALLAVACLLGSNSDSPPQTCDGINSVVDISWSVSEGTRVVADGNSSSYRGLEKFGDQIMRDIGVFKGEKGHRYRLTLAVNRDGSELSAASPELVVHIPYSHSGDLATSDMVLELAAAGAGMLGLILLIPTIRATILRLRVRSEASTPTA
jgi:hypothetical protein